MRNRLLYLALIISILVMAAALSGCSSDKSGETTPAGDRSVSVATDKPQDKPGEENVDKPEKQSQSQAVDQENKEDTTIPNTTEKNTADISQIAKTTGTGSKVALIVTKDFGAQNMVEKKVEIDKDWTVIDLLEANLKIDTKWDGSFINSIEGLESNTGGMSGKKVDWFFYINGISSDVGASGYELRPGETVWWDYHLWKSMGSTNSAVIGCYPEPFIHGYRGKIGAATVMSSADNLSLAGELQKAMQAQGVQTVNIKELNNSLLEKRNAPTIVLGTWDEARQLPWLEKFNDAYRKTGTGIHFTDKGLELLDYGGEAAKTIDKSAGVIAATGSGLGDCNPLWLVLGTDKQGLTEAVGILVNRPEKISRLYSAAVAGGEVIRLPLQ